MGEDHKIPPVARKSPDSKPTVVLSTAEERVVTLDELKDDEQNTKNNIARRGAIATPKDDETVKKSSEEHSSHVSEADNAGDQQRPSPLASPSNGHFPLMEGEEGEPAAPTGFKRSSSFTRPNLTGRGSSSLRHDKGALHRMHKFALYETLSRYYLVGHDILDKRYRVVKIDRTAAPGQLSVIEDEMVYSPNEVNQLLNTIEDGNKATGGMRYRGTSWGFLGFIRFTDAYYMLVISKKTQIATIGGHYIYQVQDTELISLSTTSASRFQGNKNADESRYLNILGTLDLNSSFYFSYSYNVTRTLQENVITRRERLAQQDHTASSSDFNDMFVWNQHLLDPAIEHLKCPYDWCMPVIHGFVDQSTMDVFGRNIYVTLIARRSRFFAGARFLKRGANDQGYVANDVETEQIVADMLVTSFNTPRLQHLKNPNYTAFVQHRGSIPLYWTQDNSGVSPKPAIDLNLIDPFYATAAMHFDHLFQRYSAPVYVLNLVKARERTPRESKLLIEYQNAINYLNQSLPEDKKIKYRAYDMSRASKTQGQDVIGTLEEIAEDIVRTTGIFQNNSQPSADMLCVQNGVVRSNCIDCLDRTNAAQFVVGKRALAYQLQALGILTDASMNYDTDASNLFAHMFNDQGDTLASQYGGSHLVNTTDSYRKIHNWQSHSRDMLESFKRYYHNSFLDNQRQEAYNLFLGNYIYTQGQPMLWDLPNDYYLHHANPAERARRRDYIKWYNPDHLLPRTLPLVPLMEPATRPALVTDWWDEYYRPQVLSSFHKLFAYHINSTTKYLPKPAARPSRYDLSPFSVRKTAHDVEPATQGLGKSPTPNKGKEVAIADSNSHEILNPLSASSPPQKTDKRISSLQKWLSPDPEVKEDNSADTAGTRTQRYAENSELPQPRQAPDPPTMPFQPSDKTIMNQWTLAQFQANSLHPSVTSTEMDEYAKYLSQPASLGRPSSRFGTSESHGAQSQATKDIEDEDAPYTSLDGNTQAFTEYIARAAPDPESVSQPHSPVHPRSTQQEAHASLAAEYRTYLNTPSSSSEPLAVHAADFERKRYRAYGKWVRGKSLFKQSKGDSEGVRVVTGTLGEAAVP